MLDDCEICSGSGIIRLAVHGKMQTIRSEAKIPLTLPIRDYPCPECGDKIPQEKIMIVQAEDTVSEEIEEKDDLVCCKERIAYKMAQFIFQEGLISFSKGPQLENYRREYLLRGKLGIISPRVVATFEERVKQYQGVKAQEVIKRAIKDIRNWN